MPNYQIKAPNGRTYTIEGPEGATDEQVRAEVLRQFPNAGNAPNYSRVSGQDANKALAEARQVLAQQTSRMTPEQRRGAESRFNADSRIQALIRATQNGDTRKTSFLRGVYEGVQKPVANAARVISSTVGSVNPALSPTITNPLIALAEQYWKDQSATAPTRGSTAGRITGNVLATIPTAGMPAGILAQGAAGGVLLSNDLNDGPGVVRDAAMGAVAAKGAELAGRALWRGVRAVAGTTAAQSATRALADRLNIRPTPAAVGGSGAQAIQMGLGNLPGSSGQVARAAAQETDDLARAARGIAENIGPVSTPEGAGRAVARGAGAFERATSQKGGALYRARNRLFGGENSPVLLSDAAREIQDFTNQFPNTPVLGSMLEHPTVRALGRALPDGPHPQITLSEATDALSHIRTSLRNAMANKSVTGSIRARVARIEQAIENDIMRAAQAADSIAGRGTGAGTAVAAQETADAFWAQRSRALQGPLRKAMDAFHDADKVSPESVYKTMVADMGRTGGNIARLRRAWGALPKGARRMFSATALDDMGRATPGVQNAEGSQWSFNTFLTNYDKMSPEARAMIFGPAANQVDDIAQYASRLRQIDKTRNFSNTARNTLAGAYMTLVGQQVWEGDLPGATKVGLALPALAFGGRGFMASPAGRAWVRNAMRALTRVGSPTSEKALRALTTQLPVIASREPALRQEATALFQYIQEARTGVPVLAGDGQEDQGEQHPPLEP